MSRSTDSEARQLHYRLLGQAEYLPVWEAMKSFTDARDAQTVDECWIVEHPGVFTLGQAGKDVHILEDIGIPIVKTDRGGQVTYHGPGQVVIYTLIDLRRNKIGVRDLVTGIETSIVQLMEKYAITARPKREAPGVYVAEEKIAALGLRVRKGCSFHGLSLNVDMDLSPFNAINPCGYEGLGVTQMKDHGVTSRPSEIALELLNELQTTFGYDQLIELPDTDVNHLRPNRRTTSQ